MSKRVLFLVNHAISIYNFRKELVEKLLAEGYEVIISSPADIRINKLVEMGCRFEEIEMDRRGTNILKELNLFLKYRSLIKNVNPSVILSYTIKPNIYGGIAASQLKVPYIANITGLGNAFSNENIRSKVLIRLYKVAFRKINHLYFQNRSNLEYITRKINIDGRYTLLPGSGVNIKEFPLSTTDDSTTINILYIGRLMQSKGINELIDMIELNSNDERLKNVVFQFVGFFDDENLKKRFSDLINKSNVELYDHQEDIRSFISQSHAVILPSHHEGMSNSLLESASMGRPLLASNIPGCKEIIDDGVNGFVFEPKDSNSMYDAIKKFTSLSFEERKEMGLQSRLKVEREFDRNIVVNEYLKNIKEILEG